MVDLIKADSIFVKRSSISNELHPETGKEISTSFCFLCFIVAVDASYSNLFMGLNFVRR